MGIADNTDLTSISLPPYESKADFQLATLFCTAAISGMYSSLVGFFVDSGSPRYLIGNAIAVAPKILSIISTRWAGIAIGTNALLALFILSPVRFS